METIKSDPATSAMLSDGKHRVRLLLRKVEWPTVWLLAAFWLAFGVLTFFHEHISTGLMMPLAAYVLALFGSLQHEVLHGHPTPWPWLNEVMVFPALSLWLPFRLYKESHLIHHHDADLTDPELDPESFYIAPEKWQTFPEWVKRYYRFMNTFSGRFFLGPFHVVAVSLYGEFRVMLKGERRRVRIWRVHLMACALVLLWVIEVCGMTFWEYCVYFVYPGLALTLVRSFLEHQVASEPNHRSVIVETGPLLSLMFLNNNLHAVHHRKPRLAWYKLPAVWKADRAEVLVRNNGYYFPSYWSIVRRFWRKAKETPVYTL